MANNVGQELLNVPFPDMVAKLALGIAEAQTRLDSNSTDVARFMAETKIKLPPVKSGEKEIEVPIIAMGFFPGYYQFAEAIVEVKMAITLATADETTLGASAKGGWGPFAASVNASYSRKYEYKVEGSSRLYARLVPVPPPAILQTYMEAVIGDRAAAMAPAGKPPG